MRKLSFILIFLFAFPLFADRYVFLTWAPNKEAAAQNVAAGMNQPLMATTSPLVPFLQLNIFYCDSTTICTGLSCSTTSCSVAVPPPPPVPVNWHEFLSTALINDPWCKPGILHPTAFTSIRQCAAYWYDRYQPNYRHVGFATTTEDTVWLWYFSD